MSAATHFHEQAVFLRRTSGSTDLEKTLRKATGILALFEIPHLVCGGFAVQEHGYPRFTVDVDLIVPDVAAAREKLSLNGFRANPGSSMTVTDRETKVEVDLLPGGSKVDSGPLSLPMPVDVSATPRFLSLDQLISAKLSTYIARGIHRAQDYADVAKLMATNQLPRDFGVRAEVKDLYQTIWDELNRA
jgi:hypothetical protein